MKHYRVHVLLLIEAESQSAAGDTVSELLRNHSETVTGEGTGLLTWELQLRKRRYDLAIEEVEIDSPVEYDTDIRQLRAVVNEYVRAVAP